MRYGYDHLIFELMNYVKPDTNMYLTTLELFLSLIQYSHFRNQNALGCI